MVEDELLVSSWVLGGGLEGAEPHDIGAFLSCLINDHDAKQEVEIGYAWGSSSGEGPQRVVHRGRGAGAACQRSEFGCACFLRFLIRLYACVSPLDGLRG